MPERASRCRASPRRRDDRGSSSVEFVLLFPLIVMLLFGGPQLGMWYFAREAAQAAAVAGVRAGTLAGAPAGSGRATADSYLARVGRGTITGYTVTEADTATTVSIHVHARVPNVVPLPGFSPTVDITVTRGRERFTTPDTP
jgi:pilus assembly protein CpaE